MVLLPLYIFVFYRQDRERHMRVSGELVDVQLSDSRHKERHMKGYHAGNALFFFLFFFDRCHLFSLSVCVCFPMLVTCVCFCVSRESGPPPWALTYFVGFLGFQAQVPYCRQRLLDMFFLIRLYRHGTLGEGYPLLCIVTTTFMRVRIKIAVSEQSVCQGFCQHPL